MTNQSDSAIMRVAKRQLCHANHAKSSSGMGVPGERFLYIRAPPSGMGVPSGGFWALSGLLPVKPLADVMANYTRHDRNTKGNYVLHTSHLLPDGRSRHPIITQGGAFVNEQRGNDRQRIQHGSSGHRLRGYGGVRNAHKLVANGCNRLRGHGGSLCSKW